MIFQEEDAGPYYMSPINCDLHCYNEGKGKKVEKQIGARLM
jgi:hypothetical protein